MALACAAVLSGCMVVGPDYRRPDASAPAAWQAQAAAAAASPASTASVAAALPAVSASGVPLAADGGLLPSERVAPPPAGEADLVNTAWWSALGDPVLDQLIREALEGNRELRMAAARIEQANAFLQVNRSQGLPQVNAGASRSRDTLSENRQVPLAVGTPPVDNAYEVSGKVSWELDLWGRIQRSNEAALAELFATEETRRAMVLSLVADVAASYVRLLSLDSELAATRRAIASRRETLALYESKLAGGGVSELPMLKARADLQNALADLPAKENEVAVLEHALSLLLGRAPGPITRGKPLQALTLPAIPAGLPADLLNQRPDIRQAEQELVAANARIGIAKAEYLPNIALTAQSGYASNELSKLTLLTSNFGSFGVSLLGPIFTSGRLSGQVREAEAVQQQRAFAYVQAVQNGLRDVEDALATHGSAWQRLSLRERQLDTLRDYRRSAEKRYEGGYSSYFDVLEAERSLYAGELQYSQTRRDQFSALIAVYKAMGGGWTVADDRAPKTSISARADHE